jgi:hypothetical protein
MSPQSRTICYLLFACLLTVDVSAQIKKDSVAVEKFERFDSLLSVARELYLEKKYDDSFRKLKTAQQDGIQSGTFWFYIGMTTYYKKDKRSAMRYLARGVTHFQSEDGKEAYALLKASDAPEGTLTVDLAPPVIPYTDDASQYNRMPSRELRDEYGFRKRQTVSKSFYKEPDTWNFVAVFPVLYHFSLKPNSEPRKSNIGGFGFGASLGAEYFYDRTHFIAFTATGATDGFLVPGTEYDESDESESMSTLSLSVTYNTKPKRVSFGYGLAYANNLWNRSGGDNDKRRVDHTLGFTFDADYQILPHLHVGATYQPSFLRIHPETEFVYQHLFILSIRGKFGKTVK